GLELGHLHTRALREILDRVDEINTRVLDHEADRGSMRSAAEAVIELLGLAHGEGRRLFAVERTAGDVVGARALERHVALDHVDDVDAIEQFLNEGLRYQIAWPEIGDGESGGTRRIVNCRP